MFNFTAYRGFIGIMSGLLPMQKALKSLKFHPKMFNFSTQKKHLPKKMLCAQDETRTHTVLRPLPPQSSVYTNFTTCARRNTLGHGLSLTASLKSSRFLLSNEQRGLFVCITISMHFWQSARDRTRTCTWLNTRTWNERVYQFRHSGFVGTCSDTDWVLRFTTDSL